MHETAPLGVDENPDEGDDLGFGEDVESDTTSIKSSILRYREENGRTYHRYKDGAYALPNDEAYSYLIENGRLDLQHTISLLTLDGKLHLAPLSTPGPRVLDVVCGTGIWSIEFADENPNAHVRLKLTPPLINRPIGTALYYEQQLADAGFVNIHVIREKWPLNRWPKDKKYKQLGIWTYENALDGIAAASLAVFTRPTQENGLGWSGEKLEVLLAGVRRDLRDTSIHSYLPMWVVYAQTPL